MESNNFIPNLPKYFTEDMSIRNAGKEMTEEEKNFIKKLLMELKFRISVVEVMIGREREEIFKLIKIDDLDKKEIGGISMKVSWSKEHEDLLVDLIKNGKSIEYCSRKLNRGEGACISKLRRLIIGCARKKIRKIEDFIKEYKLNDDLGKELLRNVKDN